jgi:hypothetical protein
MYAGRDSHPCGKKILPRTIILKWNKLSKAKERCLLNPEESDIEFDNHKASRYLSLLERMNVLPLLPGAHPEKEAIDYKELSS